MKNRTLRIGLIVAILTLVTSCFMGSTFAKYVTNGTGSDDARVAKWGVTIDGAGIGAGEKGFHTQYDKTDADFSLDTISVLSVDDVVAPGTTGTFGAFAVTGTPEVAVRVNYKANLTLVGWAYSDASYYCPIDVTVAYNGTSETFSGRTYTSIIDFEADVETYINGLTKDYATGTDTSDIDDDLSISWAWAFEYGADADAKALNNKKDTYLGDQADAGNASTIELVLDITVTQID